PGRPARRSAAQREGVRRAGPDRLRHSGARARDRHGARDSLARAVPGRRHLHRCLHALDRPPLLAGRHRGRTHHPARDLPDLRGLVPRPPAEGSPRDVSRLLRDGPVSGVEHLLLGFQIAITPYNLFVAVIGIVLGTIIGVLPGLGGANGVALLLPLTFTMPPTSAIILLTSLYWGALSGGAIISILFNIPGEPWSVAT